MCPTLLSALMETHAGSENTTTVAEFICASVLFVWKALSLVSSIHSSSFILSASSSTWFSESWGGGVFGRDFPSKAECSRVSHSLCIVWLLVSVFVPLCCRRSFSGDGEARHLGIISIGLLLYVTSSFPCSF